MSASQSSINKAVLAYSGGLDTSVILRWIRETYEVEVVEHTRHEVLLVQRGWGLIPAGSIDQVAFDVGGGQIGPQGTLNYRARFDIFGPRNLFLQISNEGHEAFQVNGTLYAVQ